MFVVFEGIDGSGKTTISNLVVRRLEERGISTCHLRADGKFASSVTEAVRGLARDSKNLALVPEAELMLYAARELQLTEEVLRPALAAQDLVVADRYLYTAEVLGRFGRGLDPTWVSSMLSLVARGLVPDLVILIDVEPALARARRKASKLGEAVVKPPSRKGLAGAGLAQRLRNGYQQLAAEDPERWVVIDNDAELDAIVARVAGLIESAIKGGVPKALNDFRSLASNAALRPAAAATPSAAVEVFLERMRRRAKTEPQVAAYLLSGFFGREVDDLRRLLAASVPKVVLNALRGLTDAESNRLRSELAAKEPEAAARSLSGVPSLDPNARALRVHLWERVPVEVAGSLSGLEDDEAFRLREALYERAPEAVVGSLAGLESERAWNLRRRFLGTRRDRVATDYELACIVTRSVRGLSGDEAGEIRRAAREVAPVAVLKSLWGLDDAGSWEQRDAALPRAPRPVLESLGPIRTSRAWALRAAVAGECKEAVDGIIGATHDEAWALREKCADLWPSTVVKSVGGLATTPRGRAFLERQLGLYGHELGVLRNASLVALGLFGGDMDSES